MQATHTNDAGGVRPLGLGALARRCVAALAGAIAIIAAAWPGAAHAQLTIDVNRGHLDPMPIAVVDMAPAGQNAQQVGADISAVIRADLESSGLFRSIAPAAFIERITDINVPPRFADWGGIGAQALVVGEVQITSDNRVSVVYRVWDVVRQEHVLGGTLRVPPDSWRRLAHRIADEIYERITGESGYFDSRIVFVSESGPRTRRVKRLMVMDQDGANPFFLTSADYMALTPRFSPDQQTITYLSYETGRPRVYLFNLETNRREVLGDFNGMTFAPRFHPNGGSVILSLEQAGNSDIYTINVRTRARTRLTTHTGIDTSPSYSPDGSQIVFTSDRAGSPQLYVMNADGSNQHRISFGEGRYSTPVWSPRGDLIAFTREGGGGAGVGVMRPDGSGERMLSQSYWDEGPTWSPNGRVVMFWREARGQGPRLWSVDLTGRNLRRVETSTEASDPAWSPLLP